MRRLAAGRYVSADGRWRIERDTSVGEFDTETPCWVLYDGETAVDTGDTLKAMRESLERAVTH